MYFWFVRAFSILLFILIVCCLHHSSIQTNCIKTIMFSYAWCIGSFQLCYYLSNFTTADTLFSSGHHLTIMYTTIVPISIIIYLIIMNKNKYKKGQMKVEEVELYFYEVATYFFYFFLEVRTHLDIKIMQYTQLTHSEFQSGNVEASFMFIRHH